MIDRLRLLYPLAFAVIPLLHVAANNPGWVAAGDLVQVLGVMLAALGLAYGILAGLLGRRVRGELLALWVLGLALLLYGYPRLYRPLASRVGDGVGHALLIPCLLLAAFAGTAWLARRPRLLGRLTSFLALTSVVLLLPLAFRAARGATDGAGAVRRSGLLAELARPLPPPGSGRRERGPARDIYLIVFDEFASSDVLRERTGLDNRAFEDSLRAAGFTVPRLVRSNYSYTTYSIPSFLNYAHLAPLREELGTSTNPCVPNEMVQVSRAARFLRARGYEVVFFPSLWWRPTRHFRPADREVDVWPELTPSRALARTEFRRQVRQMTVLGMLPMGGAGEDAEYVLRTVKALGSLPAGPRPRFVFAHIISPHFPHVFGRDCGPRVARGSRPENYAEQVRCVDRLALGLARTLRARSRVAPIILFQGDHGTSFLHFGDERSAEQVSAAQARERFGAFGAYHLPDGGAAVIGDSLTLVNVFPKVFNYYFDARLPLAADDLFMSVGPAPYLFRRMDPRELAGP